MGKTTYYERPRRLEKLSRNEQMELMFDLINSFRTVRKPIETANFLQDLLTAKEIKNLAKRLRIAKLLLSGKTHEEIVKTLHCSYEAAAKVSIWLSKGGEGFRNVISKLPLRYGLPKNLPPIPIEFQLPKVLLTLYQYTKAKKQNKQLEEFFEGISEKEVINKEIKEQYSKDFRNKEHRKWLQAFFGYFFDYFSLVLI